jgi:hypothetical protein
MGANQLQRVAVGLEPVAVLSNYVQRHGLDDFVPVSLDRTSDLAVLVSRTPSFALVDRRGAVLTYWTGRTSIDVMDKILKGAVEKQKRANGTTE